MPRTLGCPSCGAGLRPDAQWCSLCYHDLRPAPPAEPVRETPDSGGLYGGLDPLTAPLLDLVLPAPAPVVPAQPEPAVESTSPGWPCSRCGSSNPFGASLCSACGSGFLAAVAEAPKLVLPLVGDVHALSRGQRLGVAFAVLAAVLLPLALVTFLATGAPPAKQPAVTTPASGSTLPSGTGTTP